MYIIAQKLVWKSNEDGYLVGSRGSVGSSFAATMSGITEVNPLQAHYRCAYCSKYSDFDSPEVKAFSGRSGCDMPDKICPVCGEKLVKDGFDIPFETFLGFKGKQGAGYRPELRRRISRIHWYTARFGHDHVFRAERSAVAEKEPPGYVKIHGRARHRVLARRGTASPQGCTGAPSRSASGRRCCRAEGRSRSTMSVRYSIRRMTRFRYHYHHFESTTHRRKPPEAR